MQKVLFAFAHPDDEIIAAGLDIRKHFEADRDVYVLTCTRGTASGVRDQLNGIGANFAWGMPHVPLDEGYLPLSSADFGAARYTETQRALTILASGMDHAATTFEGGLQDGAVVKADVMSVIQTFYLNNCAPGEELWLKTHTDIRTPSGGPLEHPDHTAVADACRQLSIDQPLVFGNLRMYVEPEHWTDPIVTGHTPKVFRSLPVVGTFQSAATLASYKPFSGWGPDVDQYAIGWQSVATLFIPSPENRYHT